MAARTKARKRAIDVLFAADARNTDPLVIMTERATSDATPMGEYGEQLVRGVTEHHRKIDSVIERHSQGWALDRMPSVDLAILRVAVFELQYMTDVPAAVAVDEAVEFAKTLSTDNSPRFVNGVLGQIMQDIPGGPGRGAGGSEPASVEPEDGDDWDLDDQDTAVADEAPRGSES